MAYCCVYISGAVTINIGFNIDFRAIEIAKLYFMFDINVYNTLFILIVRFESKLLCM